MRASWIVSLVALLGLLIEVERVYAHHSSALFDTNSLVTLTGKVSRVEWSNPHVHVYLDVTGFSGKVESWYLEYGAPNIFRFEGLSKDDLMPGTTLMVLAYPSKPDVRRAVADSREPIDPVTSGRYVLAGCTTLPNRRTGSPSYGPKCQ
jgi:hypothetical protein